MRASYEFIESLRSVALKDEIRLIAILLKSQDTSVGNFCCITLMKELYNMEMDHFTKMYPSIDPKEFDMHCTTLCSLHHGDIMTLLMN